MKMKLSPPKCELCPNDTREMPIHDVRFANKSIARLCERCRARLYLVMTQWIESEKNDQ